MGSIGGNGGRRITAIRQVAVIGAGASGLAAAKSLLEAGLTPTVFEKSAFIGGIWTFDEAAPDGGSPAYRSLHTNTPKHQTAFSDFPIADDLPQFPAAADIVRYLNDYARHFGVLEHICFNTTVEEVRPTPDGRWTVSFRSASGSESAVFDAVFVCSGMFHEPLIPAYDGLETFPGKVLHSRYYADAKEYADQRVLVVGVGSSGIDLAVEIADANSNVYFSGRNDAWALAKDTPNPRPDSKWWKRLLRNLYLSLVSKSPQVVRRLFRFLRREAGPDAPFVMRRDYLVISPKLRKALASERLLPKPDVKRIKGNSVYFEDGTHAEVDAIVCATGYALHFPYLDEGLFHATPNGLELYRAVFSPDYTTLAFIGMSRVSGAILPFAEMQARWATSALTGHIKLPSPEKQRAQIEARRKRISNRHGNPFRIELEAYSDLLAADLGVLPRLSRYPRLWRELIFGRPIAARYRLDGPHRSRKAVKMIRRGNQVKR